MFRQSRSPVRQSPHRHSSYSKASLDRQRSIDLQSPVKRGSARRSIPERLPSEERLLRRLSPDRVPVERQPRRLSVERMPMDRQAGRFSAERMPIDRQSRRLSADRVPMVRHPRRLSADRTPMERQLSRLSGDRIRVDGKPLTARSPDDRMLGRPITRRRSEERIVTRLSPPERSFRQRPRIQRSPIPSLLDLRADERPFSGRRSLERSLDQRYMALSPPRYLDRLDQPRMRARSLERMSRVSDFDRYPARESEIPSLLEVGMFDRGRFRRDHDRGLYDDMPDPLRARSPPPPIGRRWRDELDYPPVDRYRDDLDPLPIRDPMDLPPRRVMVDQDVGVRVRADDAVENVPFRYRDFRNLPPRGGGAPRGRRQRRSGDRFSGSQDEAWSGGFVNQRLSESDNRRLSESDNRRLLETQWPSDEHERTVEMTIQPKRRRIDSDARRASLSPIRGDRRQNRSFGSQDDIENSNSRSRSPKRLEDDRIGERRQLNSQRSSSSDRQREKRPTKKRESSSDSEEESPIRASKLSSTVTIVTKKRKKTRSPISKSRSPVAKSRSPVARSRSPVAKSRPPVTKSRSPVARSRSSRDKNRSDSESEDREESQSQRSRKQKSETVVGKKDKSLKKNSRSPKMSEQKTTDQDESVPKKKNAKSPRKKSKKDQGKRETENKDSPSPPKRSSKKSKSPLKEEDSSSEPEETSKRSSHDKSPRERMDSVSSDPEHVLPRSYEMERMDSFASEQDVDGSREIERMDSFVSEQGYEGGREAERMDSFVSGEDIERSPGRERLDSEQDLSYNADEGELSLTLSHLSLHMVNELGREKTCLLGFQPRPTETGLYNHRRWLEILDLGRRGIVLSM